MTLLGKDDTDRRYYAVRFEPGCLHTLPWRKRRFDCGIFVHQSASSAVVESCVQEIVRLNNEWVLTFGADAEFWHDRVDNASVEIGRQKRVGDAEPVTAWFDEVRRMGDLHLAHCYGGGPFLLVLVSFPRELNEVVRVFRRKLRPNTALEPTPTAPPVLTKP